MILIEQASKSLALPVTFLLKLASTASHRYKEYQIDKKTGGKRTIHHPARELKLVQKWLLNNVLIRLPVHPAVTAYRRQSSIKQNALVHVRNNYLLRVDFEDFFPSLTRKDIEFLLNGFRNSLHPFILDEQDIEFIRRIVCRSDVLTIGAPTSPLLSNAIMNNFDTNWWEIANDLEVEYTRYADDIYFSTNQPNTLSEILKKLRLYIEQLNSPRLRINERKTVFSSRRYRRLAAGLVLTSDRRVSIGRPKKRLIKSLVNRLKYQQLDMKQAEHLQGWIAYLRSVEPDFVDSLEKKYALDFDEKAIWVNHSQR